MLHCCDANVTVFVYFKLLRGRKAVDSEERPSFQMWLLRPSQDGLTEMYSLICPPKTTFRRVKISSFPMPLLQKTKVILKIKRLHQFSVLVHKFFVSEEVWFSDISASEFIELDADMVFLGVNVLVGVKG